MMKAFDLDMPQFGFLRGASLAIVMLAASGCVFQPLYGSTTYKSDQETSYALSQISVANVDTRVGQQVRNHLIFLLQGGQDNEETLYLVRLRVRDSSQKFASVQGVRTQTAGNVTVSVSYELLDKATYKTIATGSREATAALDRTLQSFANERAIIDAQNRAAREAAESVRLALAADLINPPPVAPTVEIAPTINGGS